MILFSEKPVRNYVKKRQKQISHPNRNSRLEGQVIKLFYNVSYVVSDNTQSADKGKIQKRTDSQHFLVLQGNMFYLLLIIPS